jgi:hypothetical protein
MERAVCLFFVNANPLESGIVAARAEEAAAEKFFQLG